jgi:hypothetical protein
MVVPVVIMPMSRGVFRPMVRVMGPGPAPVRPHHYVMAQVVKPRRQMADPNPVRAVLVEINMGPVIVIDPHIGIVPVVIGWDRGWGRRANIDPD